MCDAKETPRRKCRARARGRESQKDLRCFPPKVDWRSWRSWRRRRSGWRSRRSRRSRRSGRAWLILCDVTQCGKLLHRQICPTRTAVFLEQKLPKYVLGELNYINKINSSHLNKIDVVIVSREGKWETIFAKAAASRRRRILFGRNPNLECRFHLNPPISCLVSSFGPRGIMLRTFLHVMNL